MTTITKAVHEQMLTALRAVRDWTYQDNAPVVPAALMDTVENAIVRAEALAAADAVLPTTVPWNACNCGKCAACLERLPQAGALPADPVPFMTLTEFRKSGREVNNAELEAVAGTDLGHNQGGRVYANGYMYVEHYADEWSLTIMNDSWTGPLQTLEAILYGYARVEILPRLEGDKELAALIDEWQTFMRDENLAYVLHNEDAEMVLRELNDRRHEGLSDRQLVTAQIAYVEDFIERWNKSQSEGPY